MAFPNLFDVMVSVVELVVGLPLIYLLSRILRMRSKPITIAVSARAEKEYELMKEAMEGILAIMPSQEEVNQLGSAFKRVTEVLNKFVERFP